ncbi:unnamed protein product [Dicrocoelium dendriticum]|nr:unnamed protein product [Dicrocoelium dendriticum]
MASGTQTADTEETSESFSVRTITLHMQSKLLDSLPQGILRFFLDDASVRLFDNICKVLQIYSGCHKTAVLYTKRVVKMNIRLTIYSSSDALTDEESSLVYDFHEQSHLTAELVLRLGRPKRCLLPGVKPSIEKLHQTVNTVSDLLTGIMKRHVKATTMEKFQESADYFGNVSFLVAIFREEKYRQTLDMICDDIEDLMDRGLL